jgi:Spy/CpxP family protein refolding chaperone
MTKRMIFTGAIAMFLMAGLTALDAQGRIGGRIGGGLGQQRLGPQRFGQQGMGPQRMGGRAGQGRGGQMGGGRGGQMGGPLAELARVDLTPDQREKVRDILEADRAKNMDALGALGDARRALNAAIYAEKPDAAAIASLQTRIVDGEAAQLAREIKVRQAVAEILTPEQRAKLAGK